MLLLAIYRPTARICTEDDLLKLDFGLQMFQKMEVTASNWKYEFQPTFPTPSVVMRKAPPPSGRAAFLSFSELDIPHRPIQQLDRKTLRIGDSDLIKNHTGEFRDFKVQVPFCRELDHLPTPQPFQSIL